MDFVKITTDQIKARIIEGAEADGGTPYGKVYGVPEGGYHIAYLIEALGLGVVVDSPEEADYIVDDIIDSGRTMKKYNSKYPRKKFYAPFIVAPGDTWRVFPWEHSKDQCGEDIVTRMFQLLGLDSNKYNLKQVLSWLENKITKEVKDEEKFYL